MWDPTVIKIYKIVLLKCEVDQWDPLVRFDWSTFTVLDNVGFYK